nr:MAG TPA: hypothetical protein [Caudoviricetes sp.]
MRPAVSRCQRLRRRREHQQRCRYRCVRFRRHDRYRFRQGRGPGCRAAPSQQ